MNRERVEELWSRFISGKTLSAAEEKELLLALEAEEGLGRELVRDAQVDGWIQGLLGGAGDPEAPVLRLLSYLAAERDQGRFVDKVRSRMKEQNPPPGAADALRTGGSGKPATTRRVRSNGTRESRGGVRRYALPAAAAALVLAGVALLLSLPSSGPIPPPSPEEGKAVTRTSSDHTGQGEPNPPDNPAVGARGEEKGRPEAALSDEERRRRIEEEMKAAVEKARKERPPEKVVPEKVTPPEPEKPAVQEEPRTPAPVPVPAPSKETTVAVALVEDVAGEAYLRTGPERKAAEKQAIVLAGQGLETGGGEGRLCLKFPDGTRVELEAGTLIREVKVESGKRLSLAQGAVRAVVPKQPGGQPMVLTTPQAEATVLGTTLRIVVDPKGDGRTRLEVEEGKVRLKRLSDAKTVDVPSGHYAVAAVGVEMRLTLLPIDEILLTASQGKATGKEWHLMNGDPGQSFDGEWEILGTYNARAGANPADIDAWFRGRKSRSWVTFTSKADANKEYRVWVRSRCVGSGPSMGEMDDILMELENGKFFKRPPDWPQLSETLCAFGGSPVLAQDYGWTGGCWDGGKTESPISLRFFQSGLQVIRIHGVERATLRLDAIRLSTTQVDAPKERDYGPLAPGSRK